MKIVRYACFALVGLLVLATATKLLLGTKTGWQITRHIVSPILDYTNADALRLRPDAPWYFDADFLLARHVEKATGYKVSGIYRCDTARCGFEGRYVNVTFPAKNGMIEFVTADAYKVGDALLAPIAGSDWPQFRSIAISGVNGNEGAFLVLQLDTPQESRAKAILAEIIDRWRGAWDACRAEGKCPPERLDRKIRRANR